MKQLPHRLGVSLATILALWLGHQANAVESPKPYGPLPNEPQLRLQELELYGMLHFSVNTFTDKEWGYGDEKESVFNPTDFDADQIVRAFKAGGLHGLILVCKHHDGFCL